MRRDVQGNGALASLEGLSGLTSVGGDFYLQENVALTGVEGLRSLASVGGLLNIFVRVPHN